MISIIQKGLFSYLAELLNEYGLPVDFQYDPKLDVLEGFRKSIRLRVENGNVFTEMVKEYKDKLSINHTLGVFNRTPLKRSPLLSNNNDLQSFFKYYNDNSRDIEFRNTYYGEVSFRVKVLFDDHKLCDLFEIIYAFHLDNKHRSYKVNYNFGENDDGKIVEPLEEVAYNTYFSPIMSIDSLNDSDLRYIDFEVKVEGPVFSPFYKGGGLLESIIVSIHAFNKSTSPIPENSNEDTLASKLEFKTNPEEQ